MFNVNGKNLCDVCFADLGDFNGPCPFCNGKHNNVGYVTSLNNGVVLAGRYVVGKVLGKGGFGVTYLCYDTKSDKKVAVKEYFPDAIAHRNSGETLVSTQMENTDDNFGLGAQKFYDEAKLVSRFNGNPNIIAVHEFFFENNTAYFVMEYLDGIDLKNYIASKGGKLPESEALYVLDKISEALVIVHSMGVLHRDISPDNIFLTEDGNVKLIDFGAARQVMGEASKSLSVILKQGFAPLEQYQKKGNQGPWTDIYALGATIYYSVTGRIIDDAMSRIDNDEIDGSDISPELFAVLQKMLSVRAENRYQSIVELKRDIAELVQSATTPELVKSDKKRFCPKCGKEVHGKQVLCNECSGTSTSANPVNYGTSARAASYGTSANPNIPNIADTGSGGGKKKISTKTYIIAACISVIVITAATVTGILISVNSSNSKNKGGGSGGGGNVSDTDKIETPKIEYPIVIDEEYNELYSFHDGLIAAKKGGKWGYIDALGVEVIPCIYDKAYDFSDGLAIVVKDGKEGFIDTSGKEVVPCIYDEAYLFSEGLASVIKDGKHGYIDKNGNEVIPCMYDEAYAFIGGCAPVAKGKKWGCIDASGNEVIPFNYLHISNFYEGLATALKDDGKVCYIDKAGYVIINTDYTSIWGFSDGMARVKNGEKYGYIDKNGNEVVPCIYDEAEDFLNGMARVSKGEQWGFVNKSGYEAIPCIYESLGEFYDGLAYISKDGSEGYIDTSGNEVIPCIYYWAFDFSEGLAKVRKDDKYGFIDTSGNEIIPCMYDEAYAFCEGLAKVEKDGIVYYIDTTGKEILKFTNFVEIGEDEKAEEAADE